VIAVSPRILIEILNKFRHSLKAKITLAALLIFLLSFWSLSFFATQILASSNSRPLPPWRRRSMVI
jgi:hypothetical protein